MAFLFARNSIASNFCMLFFAFLGNRAMSYDNNPLKNHSKNNTNALELIIMLANSALRFLLYDILLLSSTFLMVALYKSSSKIRNPSGHSCTLYLLHLHIRGRTPISYLFLPLKYLLMIFPFSSRKILLSWCKKEPQDLGRASLFSTPVSPRRLRAPLPYRFLHIPQLSHHPPAGTTRRAVGFHQLPIGIIPANLLPTTFPQKYNRIPQYNSAAVFYTTRDFQLHQPHLTLKAVPTKSSNDSKKIFSAICCGSWAGPTHDPAAGLEDWESGVIRGFIQRGPGGKCSRRYRMMSIRTWSSVPLPSCRPWSRLG